MSEIIETTEQDTHVRCGTCMVLFDDMEAHESHVCVTGFTPRDPEHYGTQAILAQKEALRRGGSLTEEKEAELDAVIERIADEEVDTKIATRKADMIVEQRNEREGVVVEEE